MRYHVNVIGRKVFVNGEKCEPVSEYEDNQSGGFRWITTTPDGNIIKLDFTPRKYHYGDDDNYLYRQTWAEIQLWNILDSKDKRYFPKILAHGIRGRNLSWLIEENLKLDRNFYMTKVQTKIVRMLMKKYGISDIWPYVGKKNDNWGVTIRGRVVIFDFGCNKFNDCAYD
jgi:hypothetical protein